LTLRLYLSAAVGISPLLPAASFGSAQPWRGGKPAGSRRGELGLELWKVPQVSFLARPEEVTALSKGSPSGHRSLASSRMAILSRFQEMEGETRLPNPSTKTLIYSRSSFCIEKPGSKHGMLGKDRC
jgi:hypothetical protein